MRTHQKYLLTQFLITALFFSAVKAVLAQEIPITAETLRLSNEVMADIYRDIYDLKGQYSQLADFGQDSFYENAYGITAVVYEHADSTSDTWRPPYYFGVTITALADDLFQDQTRYFDHRYPLLGVKLIGYEPKYLKRSQFSVRDLVKGYARQLADEQQDFLPLRLTIEPAQDAFSIGEEIVFDAVLTNVSKQHIFVKPLGPKTLYFLLNDARWGTRPTKAAPDGKQVILRSGEELRLRFLGQPDFRSREVVIYGVYNLGIEGVKPYGRAIVKIVDEKDKRKP